MSNYLSHKCIHINTLSYTFVIVITHHTMNTTINTTDTVRVKGSDQTGRVQSIYNVGGIPTCWVLYGDEDVRIIDADDLEVVTKGNMRS